MSQIRFIGYNEAITQEVLQLITRAAVPAGVVLGFEASVEDTQLSGVINIRLKPGLLSMADGMLVAESEDVLIPVAIASTDGGLQYTMTLIAEKGTGSGKLDDPVTYKVLPGGLYASQMPQVVGRLRMPLAFITKSATGVTAASFSTQDLGNRSVLNQVLTWDAPIANLLTSDGRSGSVTFDAGVKQFVHQLTETYYLPINLDSNHQLLGVTFLGRSMSGTDVTQVMKVTSLATGKVVASGLQFFSGFFTPQTILYPATNPVLKDTLKIEIISSANAQPLELQQVVITTRRIFA